ncbi:hypothetical protein BGX34_009431 [Mortierella sp. NVP85]|nr:hypothetical protein BGX34_009431 [Mortierella sp. NVP85]
MSRTATRSPGLQPLNSPSSSRTPRGLSRVQRMYDEQSVQSHNSSRASSIVATNPSAHALANAPALQNSVEYMDVDMESVDGSPHTQSSAAGESLSGSVQPSTITYENHMASSAQAGHAMVSSTEQPPSRNLTHAGTTRTSPEPTPSASTAFEHLPLFALSNPRGGTSISSSLLPIRPDSDDDDDMEHELTNDHGISVAQGDAQTQAHPNLARMRLRRNFDPAIVADLIHDQIVQSLGGAAAGIAPASMEQPPSEPVEIMQDSQHHHHHQHVMDSSSDTQASNVDAGSGSLSALNLEGEAPRVTLHRRRRRSSSMRGLLGFQPTDEQTEGARPNPQTSRHEGTADSGANTTTDGPANGVDRAQFLLSQLPFFLRIIADLGRSMRPATGAEGGDADPNGNTPTLANGDPEAATTDATTPISGTETLANTTDPAEPGTDAQPRRRHTTIRLIQIGGIPGSRRRPHQATSANGSENNGESEERDENGGQAGEDVGQTVVVLIAEGPPHADAVPGIPSDESEPGRERHRQLSPWIVMTISGAYVSSVMADGAEGANYEDLWRLANIIGPARPVTTTQEAIDNAGFPVGTFEQEVQGMRNITTLGDGTKCLVCMSDYEEGENLRALKCKHGFHQECIDKWLTTGANKCPICRAAAVVTESETPIAETEGAVPPTLHEE